MPRPPIERAVGGVPRVTLFKPAGVPGRELEQLPLAVDELEAIRLVDLEGLSHEQAAAAMGVSRQTVGRVLERGRAKVAEALVGGKAILIGGGQYRVEPRQLCCASCGEVWTGDPEAASPPRAPRAGRPTCAPAGAGRGAAASSAAAAAAAACAPAEAAPAVRDEAGGEAAAAVTAGRDHHHSATIEQPGTESDPHERHERNHPADRDPLRGPRRPRRRGAPGTSDAANASPWSTSSTARWPRSRSCTNAPHTEGGCMAPVLVLAEHNVDAIVVDGIGGRPLMGFNQVGIAVHAGVGRRRADDRRTPSSRAACRWSGFEGACQH